MENGQDDTKQVMAVIQDIIKHHEVVMNSLLDQLDDYENRDHRQNIHIRGLPEATRPRTYYQLCKVYFDKFWGTDNIEIDRVHRTLLPAPQNTDRPRDIICKLHRYSVKEAIMKAVCGKCTID